MNQSTLMGRLTSDPVLKKVKIKDEERSVANVTIAVPRLGNREKADFIDVEVWGKQAENLVEQNKKGNRLLVQGSLKTDLVEKADGTKAKKYSLVAEHIDYLDRNKNINKEVNNEVDNALNDLLEDTKDMEL